MARRVFGRKVDNKPQGVTLPVNLWGVKGVMFEASGLVVDDTNRAACMAAIAFHPDDRILFIHGPCGVGKSHIMHVACDRYGDRSRAITAEDLRRSIHIDTDGLEVLAIDDVHMLGSSIAAARRFHTMIVESECAFACTSEYSPQQIKVHQALGAALAGGVVVEVNPPSRAIREAVLTRLCDEHERYVPPFARERILKTCLSIRDIQGAIQSILAHASIIPCMQDDDFEAMLRKMERTNRPIRMSVIIAVICEQLKVSMGDVCGSARQQRIVLARGLIAHVARDLTTASYPEIAKALGRKYHSTVHTAAGRLERQLQDGTRFEDESLVELVARLEYLIRQESRCRS